MSSRQVDSHQKRPPVYQIIHDAVVALGSPTTNVKLKEWIDEHYPGIHPGVISAQRIICTVNQPSRVCYTQNMRPRQCIDPRYDFLYCATRGQMEWYLPKKHGIWSIEWDAKGSLTIRREGDEPICRATRYAVHKRTAWKQATTPTTIPVTQQQIDAAKALHQRLPQWAATDRAFERLRSHLSHFGWDRESCILKAAVINDLYSTNIFAIWRMAEHLMNMMVNPPDDPADVVEAIASLPEEDGTVKRKHWSFASKVGHFFINGDKYPIYDSFCRDMISYHLSDNSYLPEGGNPYRSFILNLNELKKISGLSATTRDLDRYMWLAGQYRKWLVKRDEAKTNAELRSIFMNNDPEVKQLLGRLWSEK